MYIHIYIYTHTHAPMAVVQFGLAIRAAEGSFSTAKTFLSCCFSANSQHNEAFRSFDRTPLILAHRPSAQWLLFVHS